MRMDATRPGGTLAAVPSGCSRGPLAAGRLLLGLALGWCGAVQAQHVSLWAGAGIGSFLSGGPGDPNGNRVIAAAFSLPGDQFRLRAFKGTLERSRELPAHAGDDDFDYFGFDAVVTRRASRLPVDLALGAARFEEVYPLGYPHLDLGGRTFVHRWGPHLAALRSWPAGRFGELWAETDLHYAPYQPRQWMAFVDIGIGAHL